jgi:glycosyltransferase involved in cell wall biosynthesis
VISVIIPAHDEEGFIGPCLASLAASDAPAPLRYARPGPVALETIVVANGCTDRTADEARAAAPAFAARGWRLSVLELPERGKTRALNAGDAAAGGDIRLYVDADVCVDPGLVAALAAALDRPGPAYAGGRGRIRPARTLASRLYARFWQRLPFMAEGVPGNGVYAVNAAGRARWAAFPDIISDDAFVRRLFSPDERHGVAAGYDWPIAEGLAALVRVRRRQNRGLAELDARFPDLPGKAERTAPGPGRLLRLVLSDPVGFAVYAGVAMAVRLTRRRDPGGWARDRGGGLPRCPSG